jgi:hypothetical protein
MVPELVMGIQHDIDKYEYGLSIILSGFCKKRGHIYGIFDPGTSACYDALGFHAIGSGLPHAVNTLIARSCFPTTNWQEALMIVYEAKKMAEKAPGVGSRFTNICIMTPGKNVFLDSEKINILENVYTDWIDKKPNIKEQIKDLIGEL